MGILSWRSTLLGRVVVAAGVEVAVVAAAAAMGAASTVLAVGGSAGGQGRMTMVAGVGGPAHCCRRRCQCWMRGALNVQS